MTVLALQWINLTDKSEQGANILVTPVTIGRAPGNDLVLSGSASSVSRRHARIVREDGRIVLFDRGSTNGTYIGKNKISRAIVKDGTAFTVGAYQIVLKMQVQCSNIACLMVVDSQARICPHCGRFLADALTANAFI